MAILKEYRVQVKRLVMVETLDLDDREAFTCLTHVYGYFVESEEKALDRFHNTVPISCLDHFEITVTMVEFDDEN